MQFFPHDPAGNAGHHANLCQPPATAFFPKAVVAAPTTCKPDAAPSLIGAACRYLHGSGKPTVEPGKI